jgi:hypothetical protein
MHYILIIMLATGGYSKESFPTLDDCMARQQIVGGHCEAKSFGTHSGTDWVNPYPLLKPDGSPRTDTPAIKAFKEGWKQEMQKHEPVIKVEQDV